MLMIEVMLLMMEVVSDVSEREEVMLMLVIEVMLMSVIEVVLMLMMEVVSDVSERGK